MKKDIIRMELLLFIISLMLFSACEVAQNEDPLGEIIRIVEDDKPVDLGLKSGTLWASKNLGAERPIDAGYYYKWAESTPYSKDNYIYKLGTYEEYANLPIEFAGTKHDPATQLLGKGWTTPTTAQIEELISMCAYTKYTYKGKSGIAFYNKKTFDGIFIPTTGIINQWNKESEVESKDYGYYWSSSRRSGFGNYATSLQLFPQTNINSVTELQKSAEIESGRCIRPVYNK